MKINKGSINELDKYIDSLYLDITSKNNFPSIIELLKHNLCSFSLQYMDRFDLSTYYEPNNKQENFYNLSEYDESNKKEENSVVNYQVKFINQDRLNNLIEKFFNIYESNYQELFEKWNSEKNDYQEFRKFRKYLKKSVEPFKYTNHMELYQNIIEREFTISGTNDSPKIKDSQNNNSEESKFLSKKTERVVSQEDF